MSGRGLLVAILLQAGLSLVLYPTAAAWGAQHNQSNVVFDQVRANSAQAQKVLDQSLAAAHEYNDQLASGALLAGGSNKAEGTGSGADDLDYWHLLNLEPTGMMARLRIPAIDVDLPVYHGTSDKTLLEGVGHLQGTSLPVGGEGSRAVLTGHRGLATATMFTNLSEVTKGDTFTIEVLDQVLTYRVIEVQVVEPDATEEIRPVEGKDLVTLVTCTPLGINTHRILVTGERVIPTPASDLRAAGDRPAGPGFPWWAVIYGVGTVAVWWWFRRSGVQRHRRPPRPRATAARRDRAAHPSGHAAPRPA